MIENMTDQEKSVMLAKCMGWEIRLIGVSSCVIDGGEYLKVDALEYPNLYAPANMALAWRVHRFALGHNLIKDKYHRIWEQQRLWNKPDAQRNWLDKILELAIEAGIVESEKS
jgi:hypothetical protein